MFTFLNTIIFWTLCLLQIIICLYKYNVIKSKTVCSWFNWILLLGCYIQLANNINYKLRTDLFQHHHKLQWYKFNATGELNLLTIKNVDLHYISVGSFMDACSGPIGQHHCNNNYKRYLLCFVHYTRIKL